MSETLCCGWRPPLDFGIAVDRIAEFLDGRGFSCAIVGALGLHAYGHDRATFDLDLATESAAQQPLVSFLEELGYETIHVSPGYSNHAHADADWGSVDIVYMDAETAARLFPRCQRSLELGERVVPVPRAEHLAAMKVQAMRNDPSRLLQDLADVRFLLEHAGTDRDEIRGYFDRAGMLDWYEKLIATL